MTQSNSDAAHRTGGITRRRLIGTVVVAGAAAVAARAAPAADLPQRGEFVVRGAHVLTMDPMLGDLS